MKLGKKIMHYKTKKNAKKKQKTEKNNCKPV